jgi:addiction module HigA family antidote
MPQTNFSPDWASYPGETLSEILEERGLSQKELSHKLGRSEKNLSQVMNGKAPIGYELAIALERALGVPARFWMAREARYREWLSRQSTLSVSEEDKSWARSFPYSEMANRGWIDPAKSTEVKFVKLLEFFGVVSRTAYIDWQENLSPMYRRSPSSKSKPDLVAAWLRQGEIQAAQVETAHYSEPKFEEAVKSARNLTCSSPCEFVPKLQSSFAEAGVVLLFVKELPGMGVSGATRWLGQRALIQVTLRFRTNDHLWFTIFHESCHILKHQRKAVFLETGDSCSPDEQEADKFAANLLIPEEEYMAFVKKGSFSSTDVVEFARSVNIADGVVVGRLQHDRFIDFKDLNHLKVKYSWNSE